MPNNLTTLLETAKNVALEAGKAIKEIYCNDDYYTSLKENKSPLTAADLKAHSIIKEGLSSTNYPQLSEEGKQTPYEKRKEWERFWMIDPLDGTKEFINKNGEFTVNIALIENNKPILGVVYAPILDILYYGAEGIGAFKMEEASSRNGYAQNLNFPNINVNTNKYKIVASKSHMNEATKQYINSLEEKLKMPISLINIGSSLKICLVAEGEADIYPRFAPTMEWDIAAGHAIVKAVGKSIVNAQTQNELQFNKVDLLNPNFICV